MIRHANAETLALYREGAVSHRRAVRIGQHLSGCDRCSELSAQLANVTVLLARAEVPAMPDRLAERIQMALAAEAADRAAAQPAGAIGASALPDRATHIPGRPDLPERSGRRRWRPRVPDLTSPRLVRGLAAAGAVLLLGGVGYALVNGGSSAHHGAPAAGGRARKSVSHPGSSTSLAGPNQRVGVRSVTYRLNGSPTTLAAFTSRTDFTPDNLAAKVREEVATAKGTSLAGPSPAPQYTNAHPQGEERIGGVPIAQLGSCVTKIAAGRAVLLAVIARYQGNPAAIVVLRPLPSASAIYDVVIVALSCSATDGHVITTTTVPAG